MYRRRFFFYLLMPLLALAFCGCSLVLERDFSSEIPHVTADNEDDGGSGVLELTSYEELKDTPAYQAWITDVEHNPCPHGESAPQVLRRSLAAIAPVVQRPEDAVCVIHGGVTAGLMMAWFGGGRYDYSVSPGQGFQVTFREGQPVSYTRIPAAE